MPSYFILFVFVFAAIGVRGVTLNIETHFSRFFPNLKIRFKQQECDPVFGECDSDNNVPDSGPTEVTTIIFKHFFCFYKI